MNEGQAKRASERKARNSIIEFAIENLQSDDFRRWVEEAGRRRAHEAKERSFRADDETSADPNPRRRQCGSGDW